MIIVSYNIWILKSKYMGFMIYLNVIMPGKHIE